MYNYIKELVKVFLKKRNQRQESHQQRVLRLPYPICIRAGQNLLKENVIEQSNIKDEAYLNIFSEEVKTYSNEGACKVKDGIIVRFMLNSSDVMIFRRDFLSKIFMNLTERWGEVGYAIIYGFGYEIGDIICNYLLEKEYVDMRMEDAELLDIVLRVLLAYGYLDTYDIEYGDHGVALTLGVKCSLIERLSNMDDEIKVCPYNTFLNGIMQGCVDVIYGGILSVLNLGCTMELPQCKNLFVVKPEYEIKDDNYVVSELNGKGESS